MRFAGRVLRSVLALLAGVLLALAGVWALAHNAVFSAWLLPLLPGITVVGPQGALLGDFKATRIEVSLPRAGRLSLVEPSWQGMALRPSASARWLLGVQAAQLEVRRLDLVWVADPASKPAGAPVDISLPVSVAVQRLQVAQAHSALWGAEPIRQIAGSLGLQQAAPGQAVHQLRLQSLHWAGWALTGDAQIGVGQGLPLTATLHAEQLAEAQQPHGVADVRLAGPLARLQAQASLAWQHDAARAAQSLKAEAVLQPFEAWPLARLMASVNGLNLADLQPGWPRTAWHGGVTLTPSSTPAAQDVQARLDLRNDLAGPWDAERVPVRQVRGQVSLAGGRRAPDLAHAWREGDVDLVAQLPSLPGHDAGQLKVQGGWGGQRALKASWTGLDARGLHGQAPPLQLQGAWQLVPDWAAVSSGAAGAIGVIGPLRAMVKLDVKGLYGAAFEGEQAGVARRRLPASVPVSLSLDGRYAPDQFEVHTLNLRAQEALAELSQARFQWGGKAPQPAWSARGRLAIKQFDPQVWLPWPAGMAGRNQLTGEVDMALDARWRGQADVRLAPSLLGGVPLSGQAQWRSPRDSQLMSAMLDLQAGGNTVRAQAEVPWRLGPQGDMHWSPDARWQAQIQAPALQGLQAVAPLLGARQVSGVIEAAVKGKGVWPALSTDGQLKVSRLQWVPASGVPMSVAAAQADWALEGLSPDAPLRLNLEVSQWQTAHVLLDKLQWVTSGSLQQHRASLSADLSHKPSGGGKTAVFHVATALQGGWQRQTSTWQGRIGELVATMGGARPRTLLQAQPFDLSWREAPGDRGLHMSTTALNVLGAGMQLRKLQWHWQAAQADTVGELELALSLDPLNLPALLASWQPQAGWGGDLLLAGQLTLKHSQRQPWVVDAFVARQSGDITLSEPTIEGNSMQRLGIREARIGLQARDGIWSMNEHFEGRVLGVLKGRQVVQATAPDRLPEASSPLSGQLDLQISNLRPWGTWVPAGWRLTGQMQAKAEVGGTLGVPQYRGQVTGQNLGLGQALLGVNLTEGQLQMDLTGDRVSLTRFVAQGGSQGGRISAQGEALLSEQPTAQLTVKAERFALLQRVDRRIMVSGEARAVFGPEDIKVDGQVQVDEGLIDITRSDAPTVGDDVNVLNRPGQDEEDAGEATSSNGGAPKRKLQADVSVELGHKLRLKGRGLDAHLAGKLRLSTPGNRPAVNGAVHVENGTFAAYGQKLVIERGDVTFTGPVENPRLDILAMRPQSPTASSSDVQVGVNITGTAQDPRVRLYSDPAMSETEKLSWLVLGRAPTGLGGTDIGLLQSAAVALLSGEGSSPSDNLVAMLGLDELTVRQSDGAVRDTVVNLGKQVSKYWYVGYERNLNATSGNWQLIYRLARRFTVRAQAGDDNAVDFIWTWKWD